MQVLPCGVHSGGAPAHISESVIDRHFTLSKSFLHTNLLSRRGAGGGAALYPGRSAISNH